MRATPRWSAYRILLDVEQRRMTLDRRMDRFHQESRYDRRDEAFVTALVYGVLRWRRHLDYIIDKLSTTPLAKIDRDVLMILRLGLFQIRFMDRVPNPAAIHTSVELAKQLRKKWLAGFVNAVLRNALRCLADFDPSPDEASSTETLALAESMPEWIVRRWIDQWGLQEAALLCKACNQIPSLTLRANSLKVDRLTLIKHLQEMGAVVRATSYAPEGVVLDAVNTALFDSPAFKQGWFQVQDEAAQAVSLLLAPEPGQTVLDACAGLGGKTAHLAVLMKNAGHIMAIDQDGAKLGKLSQEMHRLGIHIVAPRERDLLKKGLPGKNTPTSFDRILLDAPCSGLGVIRRNPDTKWARKKEDIDRCARRQLGLLETLADQLSPDGALVYAVCSTEPEETREVVKSFLKGRPDFGIDDELPSLPAALRPLLEGQGWLLTMPHRHDMDGFFAVRLRRM